MPCTKIRHSPRKKKFDSTYKIETVSSLIKVTNCCLNTAGPCLGFWYRYLFSTYYYVMAVYTHALSVIDIFVKQKVCVNKLPMFFALKNRNLQPKSTLDVYF